MRDNYGNILKLKLVLAPGVIVIDRITRKNNIFQDQIDSNLNYFFYRAGDNIARLAHDKPFILPPTNRKHKNSYLLNQLKMRQD